MELKPILSEKNQTTYIKKIIMNLSFIFFLTLTISTFANTKVYSQLELSIDANGMTISAVLDQIESETDLRFFYDNDIYDFDKKIYKKLEKVKIDELVDQVFNNLITYTLVENVVLLEKKELDTKSSSDDNISVVQQVNISGTVTDSSGNPLPGASVIELDTNNGTTTDFDGNFSLNVDNENPTLEVSFIGFQTQIVNVSGNEALNIKLLESVSALDDVVVVGYGTQNARDLTSAIAKISIDDASVKSTSNMQSLMYGKAAGVQVTSTSGEPGAAVEIRVRGVNSTGDNMPLYVIDGVPMVTSPSPLGIYGVNPLSTINASDIESIEILKDASSSAIYGARASNGVVIITTKRGSGARETQFQYETSVGYQQLREKFSVLNVQQFIEVQNELGNDYSQFSGYPTIDGQDHLIQDNAPIVNHSLNITGGSENMNFSISGNYFDHSSFTHAEGGFKRYSLRANSDIKVGNRLKFGESIQLTKMKRNEANDGPFALGKMALNSPHIPYLDPNGPGGYAVTDYETTGDAGFFNLVAFNDYRYQYNKLDFNSVFANFYGELELAKGLKFKTSYGVDFLQNNGHQKLGQLSLATAEGSLSPANFKFETTNKLTTTFSNILTYQTDFGKHNLKLLAGHEETNYEFEFRGMTGFGLSNRDVELVSTAGSSTVVDDLDHWAIRGFLGRVNYSFDSKYYLTANLRYDSSSRFSKDTRSDYFPSVSAAWRVSDESFMSNLDFINDLKLRASYGTVGNQNTGTNFAYIPTLGLSVHYPIGVDQTAVRAPVPYFFANPGLKWETSEQIDIGFDAVLFDGSVSATVDYYKKTTSDMLVEVPIPSTSGFLPNANVNAGSVENSGIELSLSYMRAVSDDFDFSLSANLTTINNEVTDLAGSEIITGIFGGQSHRTIEGYEIGHFYGYKTDGIFQTQSEIDSHATQTGAVPGDIRFVDVDGDGVIGSTDRTYLGSPIPDYFYGLTFNANYKNFDLSISAQGVSGNEIMNAQRVQGENYAPAPGDNLFSSVLDRWTGPGTSNYMPRAAANGGANNNYRNSDYWIEDGSFLRLRNVQIGYNFSKEDLTSFTGDFVDSARIYFSGQNLLLVTDYRGLDPEVTRGFSYFQGESPLANGQDDGRTPQPRVLQFGIQLTF